MLHSRKCLSSHIFDPEDFMQLQQLRYFLTAAQMSSFTNAARYHMIPQSAMSKTIAALEADLGTKLFFRENRTVRLTTAGQRFYNQVLYSLNELDSAVQGLRADDQTYTIRVAINAGTNLFLNIINEFSKKNPRARFTLIEQYPVVLHANAFDLMFASDTYLNAEFESRKLFSEGFSVAVSEQHALANAPSISVHDITDLPYISFPTTFRYQRKIERFCEMCSITLNPFVTTDSGQTMLLLTDLGMGFSIVEGL